MKIFDIYLSFAKIFKDNGFSLYMIGGTSRDYLLGIEPSDIDFVTDATPEDERKFLEADFTFAKYGSIKVNYQGQKIDVVTLREESGYKDYRHPGNIKFIKDLELDSKRRDFTINAIYIDESNKIIDFHDGIKDLKNKVIKFIGNPIDRVKEDPLRIIRAERLAKKLGFEVEEKTKEALNTYRYLLDELNPEKIKAEWRKL